jgi:hypothetical protein
MTVVIKGDGFSRVTKLMDEADPFLRNAEAHYSIFLIVEFD